MKARITFLMLVCFVSPAHAQTDATRQKQFNVKNGMALEGYDAVSYFDGRPVEGKTELQFIYKGIAYRFSTPANLAKFKASPEKYEPAYGGWCAYAMGDNGKKVKVDPETYKIIDGKLYLFYNFWTSNTLTDWNENEKKLKESGDRNWRKIVQ